MTEPMFGADVIKAPGCPHYVTRAYYDARYLVLGPARVHTLTCQRCLVYGTPVVYGQFDKSGPVSNRTRTTKDPAGKGYLKRRAA